MLRGLSRGVAGNKGRREIIYLFGHTQLSGSVSPKFGRRSSGRLAKGEKDNAHML